MLETNELTRKLRTLLHPRAALIAYAREDNSHYVYDNSYFIEVRDIDESGIMGEGRPVTVEFMNELVRGYSESHSTTPYGRIPSNLLWCEPRKGSEKYIWYNPPGKRQMFFHKQLNIPDGVFHVPGIIYHIRSERMDVYAFKGKKPTGKTPLYLAPFFNVTGSSVCLGSCSLEKPQNPSFLSLMEYWEKRFWLTEFVHLGGRQNPTVSNLVTVTENARNQPFDMNELRPFNVSIR